MSVIDSRMPRAVAGPSPLDHALAEELRIASRLLNDLAYELASDADVIRGHMESLQKIDLVTQMQLSVAGILESGGIDRPGSLVGLEDMARRLRTATETIGEATGETIARANPAS